MMMLKMCPEDQHIGTETNKPIAMNNNAETISKEGRNKRKSSKKAACSYVMPFAYRMKRCENESEGRVRLKKRFKYEIEMCAFD